MRAIVFYKYNNNDNWKVLIHEFTHDVSSNDADKMVERVDQSIKRHTKHFHHYDHFNNTLGRTNTNNADNLILNLRNQRITFAEYRSSEDVENKYKIKLNEE